MIFALIFVSLFLFIVLLGTTKGFTDNTTKNFFVGILSIFTVIFVILEAKGIVTFENAPWLLTLNLFIWYF